ncbi:MAG: cobalt-precorrin-5B (C(1))-methyltransferase [Desulfobacterales bacterium]|nr:cobalt-precorrin-5B (C(1))-methyltransferase [Desulfobacterales bacterium]
MVYDTKTKALKTGFTTGASAAAAAKGALLSLVSTQAQHHVSIQLLDNQFTELSIPLYNIERLSENESICTVMKDAGDDPDITHKAIIGVRLHYIPTDLETSIQLIRGTGVGLVTKPGLEILPGEPAINPCPRKMISQEIYRVLDPLSLKANITAEIFVPNGEELAQKTLNPRLGIVGGISILGTTGLVKPLSHEAYLATIQSALSVAKAMGIEELVFTTGRRSERWAQTLFPELPDEAFIQIGDFVESSFCMADQFHFKSIRLCAFFGKALKMALGYPCTHAAKSELRFQELADVTYHLTQNVELSKSIENAKTARMAFDILQNTCYEVIHYIGKQMREVASQYSNKHIDIQTVIFDFLGKPVFNSN